MIYDDKNKIDTINSLSDNNTILQLRVEWVMSQH